jgi:hypothetical protein
LSKSLAVSRLVGVAAFGAVALLGASETHAGSGVASHGSVGFVAGQSIRVSVSNPSPHGSPAPLPVRMTVRILDANGNALAVSPLMTVGPGQTKSYVVARASLPPQGEPGTGRLRMRAETYLEVPSQPAGRSQVVIAVAELVEETTGKHSGMIGDVRTVISGQPELHEGDGRNDAER